MADAKPNILFILTDQHRLSGVGAYGATPCRTPHLDRLAAEGTLFSRAYTSSALCCPARASIMTGLYPHAHGVTTNIHEVGCSVHELSDRPSLLPRRLQAAGYSTGYAGKWHLGTDRTDAFGGPNRPVKPSTLGFEGLDSLEGGDGQKTPEYRSWLAERGLEFRLKPWEGKTKKVRGTMGVLDLPSDATVSHFLVDRTIALLDEFQRRRRPFFMFLSFWGPHIPYFTTQEYLDLYRGVEIPPWPNFGWDSRGTPGPHHYKIHWDKESLAWADWAEAVRHYYARISMIDAEIGRLLGHLDSKGLRESTAVLFSADHGETLGSHGGLLDKGWNHFEEIQRIPLIVRLPGAAPGRRRDELASLVDVYPTVLDLAGVPPAGTEVHGRTLLPLVRGESVPWRDAIVSEFLGLDNIPACLKTLRAGDWKLGYNSAWPAELYDLADDPHETRNRIADPRCAARVEAMLDRLEQWMIETKDPALRMLRWQRKKPPDGGPPLSGASQSL